MATLSVKMAHDPPENNFFIDGLGREDVEKLHAVLLDHFPDWVKPKVFSWSSPSEPTAYKPASGFAWPTTIGIFR